MLEKTPVGIKDPRVVERPKVSIILERYYQPYFMPWPRNDRVIPILHCNLK